MQLQGEEANKSLNLTGKTMRFLGKEIESTKQGSKVKMFQRRYVKQILN
jgi:hypothetical protein